MIITLAVSNQGKVSVIEYDLFRDKENNIFFEYGCEHTKIDIEDSFLESFQIYYTQNLYACQQVLKNFQNHSKFYLKLKQQDTEIYLL